MTGPFIKLTLKDDRSIWVNMAKVSDFTMGKGGTTLLSFPYVEDYCFAVKETPEEIMGKTNEAMKRMRSGLVH